MLSEPEVRDRAAAIELLASPEVGPRPRDELEGAMPGAPCRRPGLFAVDLDGAMIGQITLTRETGHLRQAGGEGELDVAKRLRAEPGRGRKVWRGYPPAWPKRRTGWYVVRVLALLVLVVVALAPGPVLDLFAGDDADSTASAAETARPGQALPAGAAQRPTVDEPFRGPPAAGWVSGAAGITVPKAGAVGWMSASEVERALARSRDFLVASGLDRGVLRGERPERAIALINPHQKDVRDLLKTAFRTPGEENVSSAASSLPAPTWSAMS